MPAFPWDLGVPMVPSTQGCPDLSEHAESAQENCVVKSQTLTIITLILITI